MILTDNIVELKKLNPGLWQRLKPLDASLATSPVKLLESKSGLPTLAVEKDGVLSYIHSKYDPKKEAEGIVDKIDEEEVAKYEHVFFYGVGMGYLVDAFMERFPGKFFSLYEPCAAAFCHYLACRNLSNLPLRLNKFLFVDITGKETEYNASLFLNVVYEKVLFITLPSYERIFAEDFARFSEHFAYSIKTTRSNRLTSKNFQQLWTINSMINFGENLKNNTIFNCAEKHFRNKPAILAAAGPSLRPELENLRRIREEGSAYIFSVGSANKLLVTNGIYPHAAASMDPMHINLEVFKEIIDGQIDTIPLIYATSVGHETVAKYPGPKLFMMMDKDNVTPYFLPMGSRATVPMVGDAPTIAITTLQALILLGCNPIIFAGQNLAYLDKQHYSEGINYSYRKDHKVRDGEQDFEMVEDVDGNQTESMHAWILSKNIMESLIRSAPGVTFINATKRGAKIQGAAFRPLDEIMAEYLTDRVVDEDWYKIKAKHFPTEYLKKRNEKMSHALTQLTQRTENAEKILERLGKIAPYNRQKQIEQELDAFNKTFDEIIHNDFFAIFVRPTLMIENSILGNNMAKIRAEKDHSKRAQYVVEEFGRFIREAKHNLNRVVLPLYKKMDQNILDYISAENGATTIDL